MQTIGERLEEARKRKGISIREASEATKIRTDYLHKFESNSFDVNLPEIYVRGFLRTYAHYLKLNPEKILTDYAGLGLGAREGRRESRDTLGRIEVPAAATEAPAPVPAREPAPAPREVAHHPGRSSQIHVAPIEPAAGERSPWVRLGLVAGVAILALVILVWVIRLVVAPTGEPAAAPRATETRALPAAAAESTVTLIALDNVGVIVTQDSDKRELFRGELLRGETKVITRRGPIQVRHTVGRNLQFEVDGKRFRPQADGVGAARID